MPSSSLVAVWVEVEDEVGIEVEVEVGYEVEVWVEVEFGAILLFRVAGVEWLDKS